MPELRRFRRVWEGKTFRPFWTILQIKQLNQTALWKAIRGRAKSCQLFLLLTPNDNHKRYTQLVIYSIFLGSKQDLAFVFIHSNIEFKHEQCQIELRVAKGNNVQNTNIFPILSNCSLQFQVPDVLLSGLSRTTTGVQIQLKGFPRFYPFCSLSVQWNQAENPVSAHTTKFLVLVDASL